MNGKPARVEAALRGRRTIDRTAAETIAVEALGFLGSDPDRLDRFLAISGLDPGSIRAAAAEPGFLAGVLDYVVADERLLLALADATGEKPETVMQAREILSPTATDP
jgi:hypothetical protein